MEGDIKKLGEKLEDMKKRIKRIEVDVKNLENFSKAIPDLVFTYKNADLINSIISMVKKDEEYFQEFVNFLKRSEGKREVILRIFKKNLIEGCEKIKFL